MDEEREEKREVGVGGSEDIRSGLAEELLERDDLYIVTPTDSFVAHGNMEVLGQRGGVDGVTKVAATMLLLYDRDADKPVLVMIPYGVGEKVAYDILLAEEHIKAAQEGEGGEDGGEDVE